MARRSTPGSSSRDLELAVARGSLHPVVPVDSTSGVGAGELLDLMVSAFPSPLEHPMPKVCTPAGRPGPEIACDPSGPLVAEVIKTTTDPYLGRVSLVRVFSGTVLPDATVHVSGHRSVWAGGGDPDSSHPDHDEDERIGSLSVPLGKSQRTAPAVVAGDLCAIGRLSRAETSDTLADVDDAARARTLAGARPPAAGGDRGPDEERRGQARPGTPEARRRGPHPARRAQRGDPPGRAVDDGRGPRGRAARPARRPLRRGRRRGRAPGADAGDVRPRRPPATAGTSSRAEGTGSTPCAASRSSRSRRAVGSSSSTASWEARCPGSSSPRSRRGSGRR